MTFTFSFTCMNCLSLSLISNRLVIGAFGGENGKRTNQLRSIIHFMNVLYNCVACGIAALIHMLEAGSLV